MDIAGRVKYTYPLRRTLRNDICIPFMEMKCIYIQKKVCPQSCKWNWVFVYGWGRGGAQLLSKLCQVYNCFNGLTLRGKMEMLREMLCEKDFNGAFHFSLLPFPSDGAYPFVRRETPFRVEEEFFSRLVWRLQGEEGGLGLFVYCRRRRRLLYEEDCLRPLPAAGDGETASGHVSAVGGREGENFSSHSLFTVASCYSFLTFCI